MSVGSRRAGTGAQAPEALPERVNRGTSTLLLSVPWCISGVMPNVRAADKTLAAFPLPRAWLEELREIAQAEGSSVSALIRQALSDRFKLGAPAG